jgi:hypothetical protein
MKKIMQKAKINSMFKSTRTSNRCPSLPKLQYARPFFSSLSDILHVCNCNAKTKQPCATSSCELLPSMPALRRELIIYQLHMLLRRISVLNAPSWVCSCPDIFTFLHATLIMWVLLQANYVIIRNLEVVPMPNRGQWWYHKHTTGVILVNFSKPQCLNLQHAGKNTQISFTILPVLSEKEA